MRLPVLALILLPMAAFAQQQGAQEQGEQEALRAPQAIGGAPVYDIVAADRETAWRINRQTGEIVVCRIDTASSLETVRARCTPAPIDSGPQQSMTPPARTPPGGSGGSRP